MSKVTIYLGFASIGAGFGFFLEIVLFPTSISANISGGVIAALLILMGSNLIYRNMKKNGF